jgi:Xaa-Pro aminopeptidase
MVPPAFGSNKVSAAARAVASAESAATRAAVSASSAVETVVIDLWPRDEESGCWADMTRTLVVGEVTGGVRVLESVVREALERSREAVRPGITGRELHALACEVFELAGFPTQRTNPGIDPEEGFQFSLGHGVGLAVHEDPALGQAGHDPLVAGDVIAIEPGLWQREIGEVRFEDLLLVTEDGCETLQTTAAAHSGRLRMRQGGGRALSSARMPPAGVLIDRIAA